MILHKTGTFLESKYRCSHERRVEATTALPSRLRRGAGSGKCGSFRSMCLMTGDRGENGAGTRRFYLGKHGWKAGVETVK